MYQLEEETEADWWEVEALYDLCFAPGRTALSSYPMREGVPTVAPLCLCLRDDDGILAAVIRYWPAQIGEEDVLLLGPVAVHPTRQGEGLGGLLGKLDPTSPVGRCYAKYVAYFAAGPKPSGTRSRTTTVSPISSQP